jgi:autotransporter-associated beta strand protein
MDINGQLGARTLTLTGSNTGNNTLGVALVDDGATGATSLTKTGAGTWVLSGTNSYTGQTKIQNGTLSVNTLNSVSGGLPNFSNSSLGAPVTVGNGTIALGNLTTSGTLLYSGAGEITDRVIDLAGSTGGGTIDASGTGALSFTSDFTVSGGASAKILTLQGSSTADNTVSGAIAGNAISVVKSGVGSWILAGQNTFAGTTSIQNGSLSVDSINSVATNSVLGTVQ